MDAGSTAVIVDQPISQTVKGHEGKLVKILSVVGDEALVQIQGMGRIGQRRVLLVDLLPAGQLQLL